MTHRFLCIVSTALLMILYSEPMQRSVALGQASQKPDPWQPIRFFVGEWQGTADGQSGTGTVIRSYSFVLKDRFLHEKNVTIYPAQEANKKGEVHEHWSFFSYDRMRKALVLRQFHQEGFVNQYVLNEKESSDRKVIFDSENFENFDNRWKARETYEIHSADDFTETFELAAPEKPFEVYSKSRFQRLKK